MKSKTKSAPRVAAVPKTEHDFEAHEALHHLTRAEEIRSDPKLMGRVQTLASQRAEALKRVARTSPRRSPMNSKRK